MSPLVVFYQLIGIKEICVIKCSLSARQISSHLVHVSQFCLFKRTRADISCIIYHAVNVADLIVRKSVQKYRFYFCP